MSLYVGNEIEIATVAFEPLFKGATRAGIRFTVNIPFIDPPNIQSVRLVREFVGLRWEGDNLAVGDNIIIDQSGGKYPEFHDYAYYYFEIITPTARHTSEKLHVY